MEQIIVIKTPERKLFRGLYEFVIVLRVLFPLLIFKFPLLALVLTFFLDTIDGELASHRILTHLRYEIVDKFMDFWWYGVSFSYAAVNLQEYMVLLLPFLVYRVIGDIFFLMRKDRRFLFYFPNFYENIFFLVLFANLFPALHFLIEGSTFVVSLIVAFALKLGQEYWLHVVDGSVSEKMFNLKKKWLRSSRGE